MTKNQLSVAAAYQELEKIAAEFEGQELDLETFVPKYERAVLLATFLKKELKKIENQIEEINLELEKEPASPHGGPELTAPEPESEDIPF